MREGSWLCHPAVMCPAPRGGAEAGVPVAEASGCRVSGAPGSPEPEAGIWKIASALIEGCGFFSHVEKESGGGMVSSPGLRVPRQYRAEGRPAESIHVYVPISGQTLEQASWLNEARR